MDLRDATPCLHDSYPKRGSPALRTAGDLGPAWRPPVDPGWLLAALLASGGVWLGLLAVREGVAGRIRQRPAAAATVGLVTVVLAAPQYALAGGNPGGGGVYTRWLFHDHLGTNVLVTNPNGAAVQHRVFEPFGGLVGEWQDTEAHARLFTGKRLEETSGLYDFGARWYDADTGRFTSVDPLVPDAFDPQSLNAYSYVRNNPVNLTDPTGAFPEGWPQNWDTDLHAEFIRWVRAVTGPEYQSYFHQMTAIEQAINSSDLIRKLLTFAVFIVLLGGHEPNADPRAFIFAGLLAGLEPRRERKASAGGDREESQGAEDPDPVNLRGRGFGLLPEFPDIRGIDVGPVEDQAAFNVTVTNRDTSTFLDKLPFGLAAARRIDVVGQFSVVDAAGDETFGEAFRIRGDRDPGLSIRPSPFLVRGNGTVRLRLINESRIPVRISVNRLQKVMVAGAGR